MDAKTRYRQRLKLQSALARVLEVIANNAAAGIPPDRTTALLAGQVVQGLLAFGREAGLTDSELFPTKPDMSRVGKVIRARGKETRARYQRKNPGG